MNESRKEPSAGRTIKGYVILENDGGELERQPFEVPESDDQDDEIAAAIDNAMAGWMLTIGDTIRIVEAAK